MSFPTFAFAYFFLLTITGYWLLQGRRTAQKVLLLGASYVFYAGWDLTLFCLLAGVSYIDWVISEAIVKARGTPRARRLLALGIACNLALLCVFKLYDFFRESLDTLTRLFGVSSHLPVLEILLPVGLSFYTFQGLAYLIDTYRGTAYRARSMLDFLLFMAFFPKLLAGPICRSYQLLPQLTSDGPTEVPELSRAVTLIVTGLFKKIVLASLLATRLVDDAFATPSHYSPRELVVAVYAYSVQIYFDFSGYTDMARGLALLLGFELPENFAYPYAATDLGAYWRRWHMTFSSWLREYIYFPLGGSRVAPLRVYFNLFVTFLVCGIWHGSRWTFVLWGGIHGVGLAVHRAYRDVRRRYGFTGKPGPLFLCFGWAATLSFCAFARIPFKAPEIETAGEFVRAMFAADAHSDRSVDLVVVVVTVLGVVLNFVGRPIFEAVVQAHARVPTYWRPVAWVAAGALLFALKTQDVAPYIYFGF
ncbi:MAG: MBOAT family protein [Polyangiales bacterium]